VKTGAVDVMVSIGTKFFYTRSLPCTLWFFDRAKETNPDRKDKTLMLDLRDVYRKVSSNLHDFTPEHLKSIKAIVGLYRGDEGPFRQLMETYYYEVIGAIEDAGMQWEAMVFAKLPEGLGLELERDEAGFYSKEPLEILSGLKQVKKRVLHVHKELAATAKALLQSDALRKDKTRREALHDYLQKTGQQVQVFQEAADRAMYFEKEMKWLSDRFPEVKYQDVPGLCRVVTQAEIAANDYSLTAGRYVGVAVQADDGFDFEERMAEIKLELADLDREAAVLAGTIQEHLNELGL
jgi:type I restriction enzyme M protein